MNRLRIAVTLGLVSLLPLQALAADAPAASTSKPAAEDGKGQGFEKYWNKIDTNGDGVISKEEWMAAQERRFKDIDTNGDGVISKDEMKAHDQKMREHYKEMRAQHKSEHSGDKQP